MADKEGAPKRSEAVVISLAPDICLAPDKPVPFQIVAFYSDAEQVSPDVNLNSFSATTMATRIATVHGNEPGIGGGLSSGVNRGYCRPIDAPASTVRVNGQPMLRHDTLFAMNCAGPEGPANTVGKTVYTTSAPLASIASDGTIQGDTDPAPEEEDIGFWGQIGGFFTGAGKAAWELVEFAGSAIQYSMDTSALAGVNDDVFGAFGAKPPAWLPSAMRGRQTTASIVQVGQAIWNDPALIWEGIKAPYVEAWAKGRYGEAIGRGTFEVVTAIVGTKGADKLGKLGKLGSLAGQLNKVDDFADVFTAIKRADAVVPDEFASIADELLELGRTQRKLGDVVDGARKSGVLDDLLKRGKLTPDEIDELVKAGKLTPEEAAKAKKAAASAGADGALVDQARRRELGTDPKSLKYREMEAQAAERLEKKTGRLKRDPSGDADWIDANGKTYDAVGPVPEGRFNADSFTRAIDSHLLKQGLDYVVVDTATLNAVERQAVTSYIARLSPAEQARIILQP